MLVMENTTTGVCEPSAHQKIKESDAEWGALVLLGEQTLEDDDGEVTDRYEVRNCACGSTLLRRVPNVRR